MLHELGHTLGVGQLWERSGLLQRGDRTVFVGPGAQAEFERVRPSRYDGPAVPVESEVAGSEDSHWSEAVCGSELMTSLWDVLRPPLSGMTLASLEDLGFFEVNMLAADPWEPLSALIAPGDDPSRLMRCGTGVARDGD